MQRLLSPETLNTTHPALQCVAILANPLQLNVALFLHGCDYGGVPHCRWMSSKPRLPKCVPRTAVTLAITTEVLADIPCVRTAPGTSANLHQLYDCRIPGSTASIDGNLPAKRINRAWFAALHLPSLPPAPAADTCVLTAGFKAWLRSSLLRDRKRLVLP